MKKYIIIGNGTAGSEAAFSIRKNDKESSIKIITDSKYHYYYRPRIIEYLSNEIEQDKLYLKKENFYKENNIEVILNTKVEKINREIKNIVLDNKTEIEYDALLIATGARCFIPPINGADKDGVFVLRGITDSDNINKYSKNCKNAVVIGGGLLGLEAAASLIKLGMTVNVIEFFDRLLPRQLDVDAAKIIQTRLEEMGMNFILGDTVSSINGDSKVSSVILKSGKELKTDLVLISAGIRGKAELAKECGLKIEKGLIVNDQLQTSDLSIYAAGDLIEHNGKLYGIWPASREQGIAAGLNMVGIKTEYKGTLFSNELKVVGIDLYSAGNIDVDKKLKEKVVFDNNIYKRLIIDNNELVGAIVIGDKNYAKKVAKVFQKKEGLDSL